MLSELVLSTITVCGSLRGVTHHEEELSKHLECNPVIVKIDSNFAHKTYPGYTAVRKTKSNRGRKKTVKQRERKHAGDGTCMASQITFTMHNPTDDKIYKILLWRNGKVTLPGMKQHDVSDARVVMDHLCDYLEKYMTTRPEVVHLEPVMENYKCALTKELSMLRAHRLVQRMLDDLININFEDLCGCISNPVLACAEISPAIAGWNVYFTAGREYDLNAEALRNRLVQSSSERHIFVSEQDLREFCMDETWVDIYAKLRDWYARYRFYVLASDAVLERIVHYMSRERMEQWRERFIQSKNNVFSHAKYDTEIHSALIWRFKTPTESDPKKLTTVKIFSRGSVNFSGASSFESAERIRAILNEFLAAHPEIFRDYQPDWSQPDSEFSEDSGSDNGSENPKTNNRFANEINENEEDALDNRASHSWDVLLNSIRELTEGRVNEHVASDEEESQEEEEC